MGNIEHLVFDNALFDEGIRKLNKEINGVIEKAENLAALELARLSIKEVPHDKGMLQDSQSVDRDDQGAYVAYNMVYAAHLHENPQFHFQKGRKGKYLEDPLKNNLERLQSFMSNHVQEALGL